MAGELGGKGKSGSFSEVVPTFAKSIIGVGIVLLPIVFYQLGFVFGVVFFAVFGVINYISYRLLLSSALMMHASSLIELSRKLFAKPGEILMVLLLISTIFSPLLIFLSTNVETLSILFLGKEKMFSEVIPSMEGEILNNYLEIAKEDHSESREETNIRISEALDCVISEREIFYIFNMKLEDIRHVLEFVTLNTEAPEGVVYKENLLEHVIPRGTQDEMSKRLPSFSVVAGLCSVLKAVYHKKLTYNKMSMLINCLVTMLLCVFLRSMRQFKYPSIFGLVCTAIIVSGVVYNSVSKIGSLREVVDIVGSVSDRPPVQKLENSFGKRELPAAGGRALAIFHDILRAKGRKERVQKKELSIWTLVFPENMFDGILNKTYRVVFAYAAQFSVVEIFSVLPVAARKQKQNSYLLFTMVSVFLFYVLFGIFGCMSYIVEYGFGENDIPNSILDICMDRKSDAYDIRSDIHGKKPFIKIDTVFNICRIAYIVSGMMNYPVILFFLGRLLDYFARRGNIAGVDYSGFRTQPWIVLFVPLIIIFNFFNGSSGPFYEYFVCIFVGFLVVVVPVLYYCVALAKAKKKEIRESQDTLKDK